MPDTDAKPRIVVKSAISDALLADLRDIAPDYRIDRYPDSVPNSIWAEAEIVFTGRILPTPEQAPRLRWVQLASAGFDWALKTPLGQAADIDLTSTSGMHATPIAEYCLGMMLALNLKLPLMLDFQRKGEWPKRPSPFGPAPLRGKTVGIVGYGSIGRELARQCDALGMTVLAAKRDVKKLEMRDGWAEPGTGDPTGDLPARVYPGQAVATMAKDCDVLVITTPLTPDTRHLIDLRVLEAMKSTAFLINIARGDVVDEVALIHMLQTGGIAGAALDVFSEEPLPNTSPLWALPNVIVSPHISGDLPDYFERAGRVFAENLRRYVEKRPLINLLDRAKGY
ncbi:MAG: D-2-hydroxyacid dehydrogenase [Anaerolineae bacterium]|jgi:phosphoglycerate dehydrogenase-like enzyme|nr:D-2-hydroxyacid dehydrogenase [Anaerolineae bacterium]